jgi:hypothetical protein
MGLPASSKAELYTTIVRYKVLELESESKNLLNSKTQIFYAFKC